MTIIISHHTQIYSVLTTITWAASALQSCMNDYVWSSSPAFRLPYLNKRFWFWL